jgi:hypothetical protein
MDKGKDALNVVTTPASENVSSYSDERSSSRIKSQIDRTRAEMDSTLNALAEQLNPRHLFDEFLDLFRGGGDEGSEAKRMARKAGFKVVEKIKEHPIPSALAGAGLAYLLFFEKREEERYESSALSGDIYGTSQFAAEKELQTSVENVCGYGEPGMMSSYASGEPYVAEESGAGPSTTHKVKDKVSSAAGKVKDKAAGAMHSARSAMESVKDTTAGAAHKMKDAASGAVHGVSTAAGKMGELTSAVKDTVASTASSVTDLAARLGHKARDLSHDMRVGAAETGHIVKARAVDVGHQVQHGYDVSRRKAEEVSNEYPLAVGAAVLGLGVLVGLALPRSRKEDELLGEKSDELKHKAKDTSRELVNRGMQVAQVTAEETIDEAKRQGLTPSTIADKARRVASEIRDKAGEAAEREQLTPGAVGEKVKAVAEKAKDAAQHELDQQQQQQKNLQEATA